MGVNDYDDNNNGDTNMETINVHRKQSPQPGGQYLLNVRHRHCRRRKDANFFSLFQVLGTKTANAHSLNASRTMHVMRPFVHWKGRAISTVATLADATEPKVAVDQPFRGGGVSTVACNAFGSIT